MLNRLKSNGFHMRPNIPDFWQTELFSSHLSFVRFETYISIHLSQYTYFDIYYFLPRIIKVQINTIIQIIYR